MPELTWPDIPGQFLTPVARAEVQVTLNHPPPVLPGEVSRGFASDGGGASSVVDDWTNRALTPADLAHWSSLCAANPRYHDGDILSVTRISPSIPPSPDGTTIHCAPDRFMRLAVQRDAHGSTPARDLGVRLLGVKGMIVARDAHHHEHVLIARRGPQTRVYQHQWEIAPAGGVDGILPPELLRRAAQSESPESITLPPTLLIDALVAEGREELGLDIDPAHCRPIAIVRDEIARSIDVIIRVDWPKPIDPRHAICAASGFCAGGHAWEYTDSAWLARADAAGFDRRAAASIVGPMRAALRHEGWTKTTNVDRKS